MTPKELIGQQSRVIYQDVKKMDRSAIQSILLGRQENGYDSNLRYFTMTLRKWTVQQSRAF